MKLDKSIFKLEKKYQEKIQHLTDEKQEEITSYQKRYLDLLEQLSQA